jgi:hypothetical protein
MKYFSFILFISLSYGQWSSFNLSESGNFNKKTKLLFRYSGLVSTNQPSTSISGLKRISLGLSLNKGLSNSGLLPMLSGQVKVSWNLSLRGRMVNYSTKHGTIQSYGWGTVLKPGNKNMPSKWKLLYDSGTFTSFNQFKSGTIQFSTMRSFTLNKYTFDIGIGANIVKTTQNIISELQLPLKSNLQSNFISIATTLNLFSFKIEPQILLSMDYNLFSISFIETF